MESRIAPAKHAANESLVRLAGLERPHEVFGWLKAPKGGVAPTHSGLLPAPKLNVAPRASSVLLNTSVHRRGERNARQKVICVFHATFTFPRQKSRLNLTRIFALYHYRGLRNKKCQKQIATGTGACTGFHRLCSSFVETTSPGLREIST